MENIILIDYENIQNIELEKLSEDKYKIYLFIGKSQNKISFNLVNETQRFGKNLEWIKIDGNGPNALDFHIAYFIGKLSANKQNSTYIILSKDKGFDPLIKYIQKDNIKCKRINSIMEIIENFKKDKYTTEFNKIISNLGKIEKTKRPRKRKTLITYITSLLKINDDIIINTIIDNLFINKYLSEENGTLKYEKF